MNERRSGIHSHAPGRSVALQAFSPLVAAAALDRRAASHDVMTPEAQQRKDPRILLWSRFAASQGFIFSKTTSIPLIDVPKIQILPVLQPKVSDQPIITPELHNPKLTVISLKAVASRSRPSRPPSCILCTRSRLLFSRARWNRRMRITTTSIKWLTIMLQIPRGYSGALDSL